MKTSSKTAEEKYQLLISILRNLGDAGKIALGRSLRLKTMDEKVSFCVSAVREIRERIEYDERFTGSPVGITEFVESPLYLNMEGVLYPEVLRCLEEMNSGRYVEAVLTGGIGTGKTTIALISTAYQLYLLSLMREPQREFGIAPSDEIVFIFQSLSAALAKAVDFSRFRSIMEGSYYFTKVFPFNKDLSSELHFKNKIIVKPVSGADTAAIGQNVFGGILDEVNFMAVVEGSKQSRDGGTRDQAWNNYRAIARRRESRFMNQGRVPGLLCLVSSKQYPGEFTDIKAKEAQTNPKIYVYDKRVWDIKPAGAFTGVWFKVFVGDSTRKPYILSDDESVSEADEYLCISVPEEYRSSFEADLLSSLRDIAGVSTFALHPFILETEKIAAAFGKTQSILSRPDCNFRETQIDIYPKNIIMRDEPRFVHLDLAVSGDSAGVACGYVSGFRRVERGPDEFEMLPNIVFDFILEVQPPKNGEINFDKVRLMLYKLRDAAGCPIKWVTMDTYQSTDTLQILQQKAFVTGIQSVDVTTHPYDITKSAIMDGRVKFPEHTKAFVELKHLERDTKKNKIDHRPNGSKDCSDAIAGVVYGLTMRREIWARHNISLLSIPASVLSKTNSGKNSVDGRNPTQQVA